MGIPAQNVGLLLRLGFDPSDAKKGLAQARLDVARYRAEVVIEEQKLRTARARLQQESTADATAAGQKRVAAARAEVVAISAQLDVLKNKFKSAQAAGGIFREQGRVTGEIPGLSQILQGGFGNIEGLLSRLGPLGGAVASALGPVADAVGKSFGKIGFMASGATTAMNSLGPAAAGGALGLGKIGFQAAGASTAVGGVTPAAAGAGAALGGIVSPAVLAGAAVAGLVVGAVLITKQLFDAGLAAAAWADALDEAAQRAGISAVALGQFSVIGAVTGATTEDLVIATKKLSKEMLAGNPLFDLLGVKVRDASGKIREANEVFFDLADGFKKLPDEATKVAVAVELLGKGGQALLPTLNKTSAELREMAARFNITAEELSRLNKIHDEYQLASKVSELATTKLAASFSGLTKIWTDAKFKFAELVEAVGEDPLGQVLGVFGGEATGGILAARRASREAEALKRARAVVPGAQTEKLTPEAVARGSKEAIEAQKELAEQREKFARGELSLSTQLAELRERLNKARQAENEAAKAGGEKLAENLSLQKTIESEINSVQLKRIDAAAKLLELTEKQAEATRKAGLAAGAEVAGILTGFFPKPSKPSAQFVPPKPRESSFQVREAEIKALLLSLDVLAGKEALGEKTVQAEIIAREKLNQVLLDQIRVRIAAGVSSEEERRQLEENIKALAGLKTSKLPGLRDVLEEFANIIGQFSGGLGREISRLGATLKLTSGVVNNLQLLGGGKADPTTGKIIGGSIAQGFINLFQKKSGLSTSQRVGGLVNFAGGLAANAQQLTGGGVLGPVAGGLGLGQQIGGAFANIGKTIGPAIAKFAPIIGAAIGAVFAVKNLFGGIAAKKNRKIAGEIRTEIKTTLTALNEGKIGIAKGIAELEKSRTDAIRRLSGKKGGKKELDPILEEIDKQLSDLRAKQKQILDNFSEKLGILRVDPNMRGFAESVQQIAKVLKEAAEAGASAADQMEFLRLSLADLKNTLGRELREDEKETLDLLERSIDLEQKRIDIRKQAADAELAVRRGLALSRAFTPTQTAAQEIRRIREQAIEQEKALSVEERKLKAELEGRAILFNLSLEGLTLEQQKEAVLARQLVITRQIALEDMAKIRLQQEFYASLAAGQIPGLPAGVIPPGGFGNAVVSNFGPGSIVVQYSGSADPRLLASALGAAIEQVNRTTGFGGRA